MTPCAWHRPENLTGEEYLYDCEMRVSAKQKQHRCTVCNNWFWKHERGSKPLEVIQRWALGPHINGVQR